MIQRIVDRGSRLVVGYQRWDEILFLHWAAPEDMLRRSIDRRLAVDLFDGAAYVSLTPFTVRGARLRGAPPLPLLTSFHELNLRTYVRSSDGEAGVWFFSLDAASALAAALARAAIRLPYHAARIARSARGSTHEYRCDRVAIRSRAASFAARWTVLDPLTDPAGSLEHFLVERYALYTTMLGRLLRVRVRHPPWPLWSARVEHLEETMSGAAGIARSAADRVFAQYSPGVDVEFFPPERVGWSEGRRRVEATRLRPR